MIHSRLKGILGLHILSLCCVSSILFIIYLNIYSNLPGTKGITPSVPYSSFIVCIVFGIILGSRKIQEVDTSLRNISWVKAAELATRQIFYMSILLFSFLFAFKQIGISRLFISSFILISLVTQIILNKYCPHVVSRVIFNETKQTNTLLVGSKVSIQEINHWLETKDLLGLKPVGLISLENDTTIASNQAHMDIPYLGTLLDLKNTILDKNIKNIILLETPRSRDEGNKLIHLCEETGCRLLIYSNTANYFNRPLILTGGQNNHFYTLKEEPLEDPINRIIKRLLDIILSLPVVILILPLLSLWVLIMQTLQSKGPLFFIQKRTGYGMKPFYIFKYRTMYAVKRSESEEAIQAKEGDARIYPFGAFLRKTSLDEFPQFINVLIGNMSLVGPRPHVPIHDESFSEMIGNYKTRFYIKPGITGLAQCKGYRGEITDPELLKHRIENDLYYISNWSLWLDLQVIVKTLYIIIESQSNAY